MKIDPNKLDLDLPLLKREYSGKQVIVLYHLNGKEKREEGFVEEISGANLGLRRASTNAIVYLPYELGFEIETINSDIKNLESAVNKQI